MKSSAIAGLTALVVALCGGCDILGGIIDNTTRTTVRLVNNTPFPVEVELWYSDTQVAPRDIITSLGEEVNQTIPAGQVYSFARDCDELQAVVIEDADLRIIGGVGPETDSEVLRDGDDFGCGDVIVFTFSSTVLGTEFEVGTSVE